MPQIAILQPPAALAIPLGEIKRHLGLTDSEHDTDLLGMIAAATNLLIRWTGRALITTQYRFTLPAFRRHGCEWPIELPFPPLIVSEAQPLVIKYRDPAGVEQTLSDYQLIRSAEVPAAIRPGINQGWPPIQADRVDAVVIDYYAGYGADDETVPPEAKQWLKLVVRHWYDNPSAILTGQTSREIELAAGSLRRSLGTGYYADL